MHKYIIIILTIYIVFAQADFDMLVLKNSLEYLGNYSRIEGKVTYFKLLDAFTFQSEPLNIIKKLQ